MHELSRFAISRISFIMYSGAFTLYFRPQLDSLSAPVLGNLPSIRRKKGSWMHRRMHLGHSRDHEDVTRFKKPASLLKLDSFQKTKLVEETLRMQGRHEKRAWLGMFDKRDSFGKRDRVGMTRLGKKPRASTG